MHILFITDNFPPETNAPASRTYEHAREWIRLGHKVSVLTCVPNFPYGRVYDGYRNRAFQHELMDGINVYRVWSYMAENKGFARRVLDFCSFMVSSIFWSPRIRGVDVVIATSPQFFAGVAGYVISRMKRRPFILEVRDLWPEQIATLGVITENNIIYRLLAWMARYMYHHCDQLVTVGEGYQDQIARGYGIKRDRINVIPNGILPELFRKSGTREAFRSKMGWKDKFIVLYLGTHGMSQKLEIILEAAEILRDMKEVYFVFVGDGAEKQRLVNMKKEKKLDNCLFLPMQPKEKVPCFYEAADVCIVPLRCCNLFLGNYPSKMFEAMAMECPIILSAAGKSAELLERAGAGKVVQPEAPEELARAIKYFFCSSVERQEKGKNGRRFVLNHFTRAFWAKKYIAIIEKLVSGDAEYENITCDRCSS